MKALEEALSRSLLSEVRTISRVLRAAGFRSWVVGGCVRDIALCVLRGAPVKPLSDWDLATDALPEQVQKLFKKTIPTGIEHGTVTILLSGQHFEVTTLRGERGHSDGRRPDEVFFVDDLEADLARRDFTVNAMAFSIEDGSFHDPFSGRADLEKGLLRAVGDPAQRFSEDGLRVLRCARFCASLGLSIEEGTAQAIRPSLASFEKVACERVRDEWFKALKSTAPSRFLAVQKAHGLLELTAPELWSDAEPVAALVPFADALTGLDQTKQSPLYRLAFVVAAGTPQGQATRLAEILAARLRLSKEETSLLTALCKHALLPGDLLHTPSPTGARKWLAEVGRALASETLELQLALTRPGAERDQLRSVQQLIETELSSGCALTLKELAVTGNDLLTVDVPKGPEMGKTLGHLLSLVLENPALNQRQALLELATK